MPETENTTEPTFTMEAVTELVTKIVNESLNGYDKRTTKNFAKISETLESRLAEMAPKPAVSETDMTDTAFMKKQLADLSTSLKSEQDRRVLAEKNSAISKVLNGYNFISDRGRELAFNSFESKVASTSDGQWILGDQELETGVKAGMNSMQFLLQPKPVNGTGASSGSAPSVQNGSPYKANLTREEWIATNKAMFPDSK